MIGFTTKYDCLSSELKNNVSVLSGIDGENRKIASNKVALWDTGANTTVINVNLAKELGLVSLGKVSVNTPSGKHEADVYYVDIILPGGSTQTLQVCSGYSSQWDVLIGMDIIGLGDFAISNYNGKTAFAFRIPSLSDVQF